MEELILTSPKVETKTITGYKVVSFSMDTEQIVGFDAEPGLVSIVVKNNLDERTHHNYTGATAATMIRQLVKANLSVKSMPKRIIERLIADGIIPAGTIQGAPD